MFRAYNNFISRSPLLGKALTAGVLVGTGDVIAQLFFDKKENKGGKTWDLTRTAKMASLGLFITGPLMHVWYKFLNKAVTGNTNLDIAKKIFLDQAIFGPTIVSVFLTVPALMNGASTSDVVANWKKDIFPTLKVNWTIWPIAMFLNFKFVPQNYTVLYVSSVAVLWNTYLSLIGNSHHGHKEKQH